MSFGVLKNIDCKSRMTNYKLFLMSNFNYCPIVWMFTSKNPHAGNDDIKWKKMRGTEKYCTSFSMIANDTIIIIC